MVTEAIYTFKKLKHYKPFDETFFRLAKLSLHSAKQYYTTVLYTDNDSLEFLTNGGLKFDRVEIVDQIEKYKGTNYAMPKIITMLHRKSPYVHLDFDSILISKPESNKPVSFPFPEPDVTDVSTHNPYEFVYNAYVSNFVEHIMDKVNHDMQMRLKWNIFPNNSALIVNSPKIVSEIYREIIEDFIPDKIEKVTPTSLEQHYLLSFLEHHKVNYDFRNKKDTFNLIDYRTLDETGKFIYLENQEYVHLVQYNWWPDITNEVLDFFYKKLNLIEKKTIL